MSYHITRHVMSLAVLGFALLASPAHAEVLYETDFTGVDGDQPAGWSLIGATTATDIRISSNDYRVDPGKSNVAAFYSASEATQWSDYVVTSHFRQGLGTSYTGLIGRVQGNGSGFYHLRLINNSTLELYRIGGTGTSLIDSASLASVYPVPETWTLEMALNGESISGVLRNTADEVVASVSGSDTEFTSGSAGVRATSGGGVSVWEDFSVTATPIPEPASLGLMSFAALLVMGRRRERN